MLNVVAIMGRLVADPELKTTQSGNAVCSFRIACDRSYAKQGEQRQADFIDVTAWRHTAEFICRYFSKGSLIAIEGNLQTRQYQDKQGNNRTKTEILANNVSFAGSKASGSSSERSSGSNAPFPQNENSQQNALQAGYAQGQEDDFSVISDDEDLPF